MLSGISARAPIDNHKNVPLRFLSRFLSETKKSETLIFVPKKVSKFCSMAFLVSLPHLFGTRKPLKDATDDNKDYRKIPIL